MSLPSILARDLLVLRVVRVLSLVVGQEVLVDMNATLIECKLDCVNGGLMAADLMSIRECS